MVFLDGSSNTCVALSVSQSSALLRGRTQSHCCSLCLHIAILFFIFFSRLTVLLCVLFGLCFVCVWCVYSMFSIAFPVTNLVMWPTRHSTPALHATLLKFVFVMYSTRQGVVVIFEYVSLSLSTLPPLFLSHSLPLSLYLPDIHTCTRITGETSCCAQLS